MVLNEKTLSSQNIFDGRILHVTLDEVELPDGRKSQREIVNHPGGVAVVAIDEENNLLFVKQFRYPFSEVLYQKYVLFLVQSHNAYSARVMNYLSFGFHSVFKLYIVAGKLYNLSVINFRT